MDITPQGDSQQSISDDQELAKALAGVLPDVPEPVVSQTTPEAVESIPSEPISVMPQPNTPEPSDDEQAAFVPSVPSFDSTAATSDLESIKKDALSQLRPLIGKVDLPAEEKFDTYLMLIRSTDDSTLIAPAHVVAQGITDETRRAEALLEIIKEIDYLSRNNQPTKI